MRRRRIPADSFLTCTTHVYILRYLANFPNTMEGHITFYFELGLEYTEIRSALKMRHNITVSVRHLKRILAEMGLNRRKIYCDLGVLVEFIQTQLQYSGQLHGYRWMYAKCRDHGLRVRKEDVRLVLKELDPRGVTLRQARRLRRRNYFSKGPNFIWHLDCYDKLKPYGFCISGCIDGFSREMIWLNVYTPRTVVCVPFSASSSLHSQTTPWTVTWREPVLPIKGLNIGGAFFATSARSSGCHCLEI